MIETDLPKLLPDLTEVENLFSDYGEVKIKHLFNDGGEKVVNTVVVNGKAYAFGTLIGDADGVLRKRLIKRYAKLALYKALSKTFGVSLAWGSLTGIRPTKLAYVEIKESGDFRDFFRNVLMVSEEKTALTAEVIESQKGIYETAAGGSDFFVFIPFCPSRCEYCSFISRDVRGAEKLTDEYVKTLIREIEKSAKYVKNLRSIYVGGGTPVALGNDNLEKVLCALDKINCGVEYTVEAGRPDAITRENLNILKAHGVSRVCVNPQTFSDTTLKRIGRNHTAADVYRAYDLAKNDFSVNMDLIAGLPGENYEVFCDSLEKTISLLPDDITVHTLCVKKGSRLAESADRLSAGDAEKCVSYSRARLKENGYSPYYLYRQKYMAGNLENVGYAKKGGLCVFNVDTMEEITDVVACGANAISKTVKGGGERIERYAAPKDVKTYLDKVDEILRVKEGFFGGK
ncbi:MAG: coproporphyrinogen dehydrogenase HemZ [Clostridia bacterium]|nr:coproporphyrinogen dehydrogenase HemZ [Clostridia bacterium]